MKRLLNLKHIYAPLFLILLYAFVLGPQAAAQPDSVVLTDEQKTYPLGFHLEILEDKEKAWTIDDVTSADISAQFLPSQEAVPGFGFTDSAYWVRFQASNESSADVDWVLLIESAPFYVDAYFPSASDEGYEVIKTGTALPFDTRDLPVGQLAFFLPIDSGESITPYLRFSSAGSLSLPLTILRESAFGEQILQQQVFNGILYGVLLILAIYNLTFLVVLKDRSYLFYILFFGTILIGVMSLDGFAAQYLWPNLGYLAATMTRFFMILSIIFALFFATSFLRTKEYTPRLHKVMIGLAIMMFVLLGLQYIWFRETAIIHAILLVISLIIMIIAGVIIWRKGYAPARYYLFAWLAVIIGFTIFFLTLADLLPFSGLTNIIFRVGLIFLALVLSFGLADRINLYRQEKVQAQLDVSYQRAQIARDLHDSVTQSLYSANLFAEAGRETLQGGDVPGATHYFGRIGSVTQQALKEMRLFLYELRPADVIEDGLVDALQKRLDTVEKRSGIEARLILDGTLDYPDEISDQFFRICQEALNNVVKHAEADEVQIYLQTNGLQVVDNGRGFIFNEVGQNGGLGLQSMQERAEKINADFTIQTAPGQGTTIQVKVRENDG